MRYVQHIDIQTNNKIPQIKPEQKTSSKNNNNNMINLKMKGTLYQKKIAAKIILMEKLAADNIEIMHQTITILPIELTRDENLKNYLHKFSAYLFIMDQTKYKDLHIIFKKRFKDGLDKYPNEEDELHHALIINGKVYLGYDGYGINEGTKDIKLAKKL